MTEQPDTTDIAETLRAHRDLLALSGHEQLDAIEAAASQGKCSDVHDAVDKLHTLLDILAGIVVEPDFEGVTRRLDRHAIELAENDDYEGARLVVETAEAFGRRQMQLAYGAFRPRHVASAPSVQIVNTDAAEANVREARRRAQQESTHMRRR
ncbi:hypothetical protein [Rhodococcus pyridinivorans]|uniref:hypothetical protein n=1 Tax=Rhodococcus pyridinivorans TaxID=103816 RepID=UPI003AAFDD05